MNRRRSVRALLALAVASTAAWAQPAAKPARITYLVWGPAPNPPGPKNPFLDAFQEGLRALGYSEGRDVVVEVRWTMGNAGEQARLGDAFAALKTDVIVATGETSGRAAQQATTTIPIVLAYSADPVAGGFAKSLARPGGNITGIATLNEDLSGKMLELLLDLLPKSSRLAVLGNPGVPSYASVLKNLQEAARAVGVNILSIEARSAGEIESGFARMAKERVSGVVVLGDPLIFAQRRQIAELASKQRIASVYPAKEHVDAGGLMSYGVDIKDGFRRAATYVDKILKGAKPGELPIEQARTLELAINLKTAKDLGIKFPQSILVRADQVVE